MIDIDIARRLKHAGLRWEPTNGDVFTIDNEQLRDEAFMLSSMVIEPMIARNGNRLFRFNGTTERSEEHTSELQSRGQLVCRLLLEHIERHVEADAEAGHGG